MPARSRLDEGRSSFTRKLWLEGSAAGTISATVPHSGAVAPSTLTGIFIPMRTAAIAPVVTSAALADQIAARGLAVDVLINNAGLGGASRFDRQEIGRIGEILQVNIVALAELTRLLLPGMVARGRGRIMLVASTAAFLPGPEMALYFASKAFVLSLGEALAHELRGSGVTLTTLCPGSTDTAFFTTAGADNTVMAQRFRRMMSADAVARIGCSAMAAGRPVVVAGLANRLMTLAARLTPHRLTLPVTQRLMRRD